MGRQHDFRMDYAAFPCVVVGQPVPLVCQLFPGAVGRRCYGRFALAPADYLNAAMVDCYGITSRIGYLRLVEREWLTQQGVRYKYTKG